MIGVVEKSLVHLVTSSHCSSVARVGEPREQRLQSCFTMFTIWDLSDLWKAIGSCCYTRQEWATGSQAELRLSKRVLPGPKRLAEGAKVQFTLYSTHSRTLPRVWKVMEQLFKANQPNTPL